MKVDESKADELERIVIDAAKRARELNYAAPVMRHLASISASRVGVARKTTRRCERRERKGDALMPRTRPISVHSSRDAAHPEFCVLCVQKGRLTLADQVDHITPCRDDRSCNATSPICVRFVLIAMRRCSATRARIQHAGRRRWIPRRSEASDV